MSADFLTIIWPVYCFYWCKAGSCCLNKRTGIDWTRQKRRKHMNQAMTQSGNFVYPELPRQAIKSRRATSGSVQDIWRQHGWVPPTEYQKDFRSSLRTTAHLVPQLY